MKARSSAEKTTQLGAPVQVRLEAKIESEIEKISEITGLTKSEIIRQCAAAGAKAIAKNGYKLTLPLNLEITTQEKEKAPEFSGSEAVRRDHPAVKGSRLS